MTVLSCTTLLLALGGCPAADAPAPPALLRSEPTPPTRTAPRDGAVWPLAPRPEVTREFQAPPQPWAAGHRGVDLAGRTGQAVRAAHAGRVVHSGMVAGRGVVSVEHADGWRTTYEPLTDRIPVGTVVQPGAEIGRLAGGASHCAPASCLHWGLRVRPDEYRDPLTLVGGRRQIVLLPLP